MLNFYKVCISKAFSGKFWAVEKWTGGLALFSILVTRLLPAPVWMKEMLEVDGPLYFFLLAFFITVFVGFVTAPYSLYKEQLDARIDLEKLPKAILSIFVKDTKSSDVLRGVTSESPTGSRQLITMANPIPSVLSIICKNTGDKKASNCIARIIAAKQTDVEPERVLDVIDSISLSWDQTNTEDNLIKDIAPNDVFRIWIASIHPSGHMWVFREIKKLPTEYQKFFGGVGEYEIVIQVDSDNCLPIQTKFRIVSHKPKVTDQGMQTAGGEISILAQGSPLLPL